MRGGRNTRRSSAELTQVCKLQSNVLMESSSLWHERVVRDSLCLMDEMSCFYRVWGFLAFLNPIRVAVNKNKAICILFWNKMFKLQRMNSVLQTTPKKLNLFVDFAVRVSLYPDVINTQYWALLKEFVCKLLKHNPGHWGSCKTLLLRHNFMNLMNFQQIQQLYFS